MEAWLKQLIKLFREEVNKAASDRKVKISNLDDLSFPCQVDAFWFHNERFKIDFQLIIFQHFEDSPDLEMNIYGPIPFDKAIDELERILLDDKWGRDLASDERYLIEDGERTLRRILENELLSALEELRRYALNLIFTETTQPVTISHKTYVSKESFAWFVWGDIRLKKPEEIVNEIVKISVDKAPKPSPKPDVNKIAPKSELKAYGTYFYPPIWIGEIPKRSFKEKARGQFFPKHREHFVTKYRGFSTIVQQDGLLIIVNESKTTTLNMLNEIMGVALIMGLPCYAIRESEVGEIKVDSETFAIKGSTMPLGTDRTRQGQRFGESSYMSMIIPTTLILSVEEILDVLNRADKITEDDEIRKSLLFLLESFTHLQSFEYPQCFIMGWTVIERYIASVWDSFLKRKSISGKRRKKLQGLLWTTDDILEVLNLAGEIYNQDYISIMSLKDKRNKIIHQGLTAVKDDAEQCFTIALLIVQRAVQSLGEFQIIQPERRLLGIRD